VGNRCIWTLRTTSSDPEAATRAKRSAISTTTTSRTADRINKRLTKDEARRMDQQAQCGGADGGESGHLLKLFIRWPNRRRPGGRRKATSMKIVVLTHKDVSSWYAATLMERGHEVTIFGGGAIHGHLMKGLSDYDGCLLLGDDPDLVEFAGLFEAMGKKVWRQLADIPASKAA
jgi:hypothetical protein